MYKVSLKGENIGYISSKKENINKVNTYLDYGEGEKAAFAYIEEKPTYNLCLIKKDVQTNEEEVLNKVKQASVMYYETYVIKSKGEDKLYVATKEDAENVIKQVQDKKGEDTNLQYEVRYEKELNNTDTAKAVEDLYVKKVVVAKKNTSKTVSRNNQSQVTKSPALANGTFIKPVGGTYTTYYGKGHGAVDLAGPVGTPILASASGTVASSRWAGGNSYGELVTIKHDNGYVTYYAHLSRRDVSVGQRVEQGQVIGLRGSTGRSTGPHLHFEIRDEKNRKLNPRNYF